MIRTNTTDKNFTNLISSIYTKTDDQIIHFILKGKGFEALTTYKNQSNTWEYQELLNFRAWALNQTRGYNHS